MDILGMVQLMLDESEEEKGGEEDTDGDDPPPNDLSDEQPPESPGVDHQEEQMRTGHRRVEVPSVIDPPPAVVQHMFADDSLNQNSLWTAARSKEGVRWVGNPVGLMDEDTRISVKLLKILKDKDLKLFDQIMEWKRECDASGHSFGVAEKLPTRSGVIKKLQKIYGHDGLSPKKKKVELPCTKETADITLFPFQGMLLSLLTDPFVMQPENLSFSPDDPFLPPKAGGRDGHYDGIETGSISETAHRIFCTEPNDILCELILFIDKTYLDVKGRHTLEPVMFTLGIFNRGFRNQHRAWRPLGFIPNIDVIAQHCGADDKQQDKAWCLRILLSELVAHQELGGLRWDFAFGDKSIECRLQIPVHTVMGDTVGFEWLLGKVANKGTKGREGGRLCRQCSVPFRELGMRDPSGNLRKGWSTTRVAQIRRLRNKPSPHNQERLRKMGYKIFHDGMVEVHFSDPIHGLHGCTPPEVLHAFQLGLEERAIELLLGKRKRKKRGKTEAQTKKRQRSEGTSSGEETDHESEDEDGEEEDDDEEEGEVFVSDSALDSKFKVFSAVERRRVDNLAKGLHRHFRRQSDRALPRTDFAKHGTANGLAKMQGHERTGVLLVLLCVMVMDHWAFWRWKSQSKKSVPSGMHGSIEEGMGPLASNVVKTLSLLIQMESFMRCERIRSNCLRHVDEFVPVFMDQFLRTFDRSGEKKTAGNNTVKNHYPHHIVENIRRGGSPQNSNSSIGESLHVTAVKRPGRRTNMHTAEFEPNTGERYVENITVDRSSDDLIGPECAKAKEGSVYDGVIAEVLETGWITGGNKRMEANPSWPDSLVSADEVFGLVRSLVIPNLPSGESVTLFSSTTRDGVPFRANPMFRNGIEPKQEWVLVKQSDGSLVPHQFLCIVEVPTKPRRKIYLNGSVIDEEGFYAIAHCAVDSLRDHGQPLGDCSEGTRAHADQTLLHWIPKGHSKDGEWVWATESLPPSLLFVPCEAIAGPVAGFPDLTKPADPATDYFFIRPQSDWAELFVEAAKRGTP